MRGHRTRDLNELMQAKNKVRLKKNVLTNKKDFRKMFNEFMAPRPTDSLRAKTITHNNSSDIGLVAADPLKASHHTLLKKPLQTIGADELTPVKNNTSKRLKEM